MTYWLHAYCQTCKCASPSLFVTFGGKVSLYPLDDSVLEAAEAWIEEHAACLHDVRLIHENDDVTPGPTNITSHIKAPRNP